MCLCVACPKNIVLQLAKEIMCPYKFSTFKQCWRQTKHMHSTHSYTTIPKNLFFFYFGESPPLLTVLFAPFSFRFLLLFLIGHRCSANQLAMMCLMSCTFYILKDSSLENQTIHSNKETPEWPHKQKLPK